MSDATDDLASQRTAFVEKIGVIAQIDGLPRAAGRVFGLLVWEGGAVAFGDLARRLDLSRGSVSSSVRLLEERGVVRRVARSGDRQDWFEMMPDPFSALLDTAAVRVGRAGAEIGTTLDALPPDAAPRPRVAAYARFYETLERQLRDTAEALRGTR